MNKFEKKFGEGITVSGNIAGTNKIKGFIEVEGYYQPIYYDGRKFLLRIGDFSVRDYPENKSVIMISKTGENVTIKQSYEEVKNLIREAME